jgi:hypothetical protein
MGLLGSTERKIEVYALLVAIHVPSGQAVVLTASQTADVQSRVLTNIIYTHTCSCFCPQLVLIDHIHFLKINRTQPQV